GLGAEEIAARGSFDGDVVHTQRFRGLDAALDWPLQRPARSVGEVCSLEEYYDCSAGADSASFTGSFDFSSETNVPSGPTSLTGSKPADCTAFHAAFTSTTFF